MSETDAPTDVGIEFGKWRLVPHDSRNWELFHYGVTKTDARTVKNGTAGKTMWRGVGRFYQHQNLADAVRYAADYELKRRAGKRLVKIADAMDEHESIVRELIGQMQESINRK